MNPSQAPDLSQTPNPSLLPEGRPTLQPSSPAPLQSGVRSRVVGPARDHQEDGPVPNISDQERWFSLAGGAAVTLAGMGRGDLRGWAMMGLGAALIYRGYTQHCYLYDALDLNSADECPARNFPPN